MIVVDVNLLLYAYNADAVDHVAARQWFENALTGADTIALPHSVIHAFIRLTTTPRVMPSPLTSLQAVTVVEHWLANGIVSVVEPGPRYWSIFRDLLVGGALRGNVVNDAHIAALAIEHNGTVYTADRDFARFRGARVVNPLAS